MTQFVEVPPQSLQPEVLQALLEEYASRDGTDYGEQELPLSRKVSNLRRQIEEGVLRILFEVESEHWDLVPAEQANLLLEQ